YRPEIDDTARCFGEALIAANPGYAPAYVLDICATPNGLRMLETNCINAAGFYAADLVKLAAALCDLP
ncbi:MAG: ATP-grasp domain-containing protein, partial [Pseudomonadota bacterium]